MMGDRLPAEETRGGEKHGDWKVSPEVIEHINRLYRPVDAEDDVPEIPGDTA